MSFLPFFSSRERRTRRNADNWLELADKVWRFRRDILAPAEAEELSARSRELRRLLAEKADAARLKLGIESLEGTLRRTGGAIYPKTSLTENVEFFLVAAIVILGIRSYFVQPFKIPTNSMWPTYYGMTAENLPPDQPAPGAVGRAFRFLAFLAERREMTAPRSGAVEALFFRDGRLAYTQKPGRTWFIFPTTVREYTFYVDGAPTSVRVPLDFSDFDQVVTDTFFGGRPAFAAWWKREIEAGHATAREIQADERTNQFASAVSLRLPVTARAGAPVVRFDIMTGDQLFVDRISYQFMRPQVGQGFVFRTDDISGIGEDEYYIKRLVGVPGDTLEVKEPVLYRNGRPISGAEAFERNARRIAPYTGYTFGDSLYGARYLFKGETVTVPPRVYFAMGDNSSNSSDGRVWGFVPEKDVIGRPLFIYYPLTRRWGVAR